MAQQYSCLIASLIDERYEWYFNELTQSKAIETFLLTPPEFENMLELIQLACQKAMIPIVSTGNLIEALQAHSSKLMHGQIEEPDQESDFNELVQNFFQTL